jgi:hypothetical protein
MKTSLFLLSFFKFEVDVAPLGWLDVDSAGLMLIAVGFATDEPIADAMGIPAPPTAEATATSTLGAEG